MSSNPFIVFFDTFVHTGQNKESIDCVRFKSGVELVKICILPFGSVVESNLSDEPLLGATNPASFDMKVYSNSRTNCIVLQNVAKYHFNEKTGINTIYFENSLHSNFLLFRGVYSTLTVALFGFPAVSVPVQSLAPATNLSIPPPTAGINIGAVEAANSGYYNLNKVPGIQTEQKPDVPNNWQQYHSQTNSTESYMKSQSLNVCSLQPESELSSIHPVTEADLEEKVDDQKTMNIESAVLYEDGEIQDVDYEEISSNEELFSEIEDGENLEIGDHQSDVEEIREIESHISSYQWRFNPFDLINQYSNVFSCDFRRIADPTITLFELHCWLLEQNASNKDQLFSENEPFNRNPDELEVESNLNLLPPPDDWADASQSAEYLIEMTKKYCSLSTAGFHEEWIDCLENIGTHLPQGLAFLYCTDRNLYQAVTETLLLWVYSGLNMDLALSQPNASYIVKHITVGVHLAGLMTSTTTSELASALLYPETLKHDGNDSSSNTHIEGLQVQHLLLDLLESPLITTPLRLSVCRALDQTTRLPIGLNAFLGVSQIGSDEKVVQSCTEEPLKTEANSDGMDQFIGITKGSTNDEQYNVEGEFNQSTKLEQIDDNDDVEMLDRHLSSDRIQSPYQRFIFIVSGSKNSRVTAAYERLLNKVHTYELLSGLRDLVNQFQKIGEQYLNGNHNDILQIMELEQTLVSRLRRITHIFQNAEQIIANPRSTLPCPLLLNESKRIAYNPYADLCSMLDSCGLIDSLTHLINTITNMHEGLLQDNETDNQYEMMNISSLVGQIQVSICELLRVICSHSYGLLLFAYRPESTSLLVKSCLQIFSNGILKDNMNSNKSFASEFFIFGLELIYKIEALRYLDLIIDWTRKKGMTGIYSFVTQLQSETSSSSVDLRSNEAAILRDALFGLTRLTVNTIGQFHNSMDNDGTVDDDDDDDDQQLSNLECLKEFVHTTLNTASPIWIADVIAMDDYFAPFLMLTEAFAEHDVDIKCAGNSTQQLALPKTEKSKASNEETKSNTQSNDPASTDAHFEMPSALSSKATIHNLLSGPIQLNNLVNTLIITVLRHSEDVSYLDRYGFRLAQLITPHQQIDCVEDITPIDVLVQLNSFTRIAPIYINWLRDGLSRSHVTGVFNVPTDSPLSPDACSWLISQLQTMSNELTEALDTLLDLEVAEDLIAPNTTSSHLTFQSRKLSNAQIVTAGRCIPPSILLVLRLLRTHILGSSRLSIFDRLSYDNFSKQQIILSRTNALISIISMNGLNTFITLIQKLSDFFILQLQATLSHANNATDLIDISSCDSNASLVFSIFDSVIQIVSVLLRTIIPIQGEDFQDTRILHPLFYAYACTIFTFCPPGPKAVQLERIRDSVITGVLAYTHSELNRVLNIQEINKSLWVLMLKELIRFTISSPCFFLPGLLIFIDLLPLPLPIVTVDLSFGSSDESKINSSRDVWAAHLLAVSSDLIGMIQLLSATISSPNNLLFCTLFKFVERLVDISLAFASLLANACLDSINDVRTQILNEPEKEEKETAESSVSNEGDNVEELCSKTEESLSSSENRTDHLVSELNTPSTKLLLNPQPILDPRLSTQKLSIDACRVDNTLPSDSEANVLQPPPPSLKQQQQQVNPTNAIKFSIKQIESTELNAALSLLFILLKIPVYRYAVLDALRQQANRHAENTTVTEDGNSSSSPDSPSGNLLRQHFLSVIDSVLTEYSDKNSCISVQLKILQCLSLLVDVKLSINNTKYHVDSTESEAQSLSDNLPDLCLLKELVLILIKHINHPDRDMSTLPSALDPLIIITDHDPGFVVVKEALDSPVAFHNGQHLFANLVQRVNDCFSADNPDCQATLTGCLRLIQSLVIGHSTLPLTFISKCTNWDEIEDVETKSSSDPQIETKSLDEINDNLFTRQLHISGERVRELLGWSGSGDHGKPVRDLHSLLEMLADDEPSLEYLRSGMKNLLSLLSNDYDIPELKELTATNQSDSYKIRSKLPNPRSLDILVRDYQKFIKLSLDDNNSEKVSKHQPKYYYKNLSAVNEKISEDIDMELPSSGSKFIGSQIPVSISYQNNLVQCDLNDIATNGCNGLRIREELAKCGRQQDSSEVAIRHQKRRRGQSTIIQTGISSKKFVAPMRGRGFMLRSAAPSNPIASNTVPAVLGANTGQLNTNVPGVRVDPFRSRPLNTSRPPSLHVDDFTKLEKEEGIIEQDTTRSRPYRDTRIMRGRGGRYNPVRGSFPGHSASNVSSISNMPFGMKMPTVNQLHTTALLPNWPVATRPLPLLPFSLDPRVNQERRDRHGR
ncbi:unnamed protein product [Trichobilharzia szidati]|nr:unnamed protein product [Trichobilharzia szidati]